MNREIKIDEKLSFQSQKGGIEKLQKILKVQNSGMMIVDLDDTTKEAKKYQWTDGVSRKFLPETLTAFIAIHKAGIKLGIATEQPFVQISPFISDIAHFVYDKSDPYQLFNGLIVGEGGSVIRTPDKGEVVLAPRKCIEDKEKIVSWLKNNVGPSVEAEWSILNKTNPNTSTFVQLPPDEDNCTATASLWEKGPHISEDPSYTNRYSEIELAVQNALKELDIESLTTYEAGNGTLRITPKYINKGHSFSLLGAFGLLNFSQIAYACDGPNDVKLAEQIKLNGGGIIAVGNAIPRLHEISDLSAINPAGLGFAEAVALLFPNEYQLAAATLSKRNIKLIK